MDFTKLRIPTAVYTVLVFLVLMAGWEAVKLLGEATDYRLTLGPVDIDLKQTRDLNMPHLKDMFEALEEPAQREGDPLIQVLIDASLFTMTEALLGFTLGTALGLFLAILFVHSKPLSKGLMPYVVASQTVPILALAPMVVVWTARAIPSDTEILGWEVNSRFIGVSLIAAYLAFFPVTIYALRGLADVPQTSLELMHSYAATRWEILWKLRLPNAIPYLFTALKITAPASVVGAVIGELPSGIQDGLGYAIINYAQYYTSAPPRLWATNIITALTGILFFVAIALLEKLIVRWKPAQ
jgi:NitT/TauT family transport system permease protein